jgi:hypothetical protein
MEPHCAVDRRSFGLNGTGTKWDLDIDNMNGGIEVGVGRRSKCRNRTHRSHRQLDAGHLTTLPVAGGNVGNVKTYLNGTA